MEITLKALLLITTFFTGFGIVIPVLCFVKTKHLQKIEFKNLFILTAVQAVRIVGILYVVLWVVDKYLEHINPSYDISHHVGIWDRLTGPYWFIELFPPVGFLLLSQLFWVKKVYHNKILLVVAALLLFVMSLHRMLVYTFAYGQALQEGYIWQLLISCIIFIFTTFTIILATGKLKTILKQ